MAVKTGFFNKNNDNDNKYQDVDFANMLSLFVGQSGYIPNYLGELKVVCDEADRSVKIMPGGAWIGDVPGWWYIDTEVNDSDDFKYTNPGEGVTEDFCIILKLQREDIFKIEALSVNYPVTDITNDLMTYYLPLAKVTISGDSTQAQIEDMRVPCIRSTSALDEKSNTWTLSLNDLNKMILCKNTSDIYVEVPSNIEVEFPINAEIVICQYNASLVTARPKAGSGVLIRSLDGNLTSDGQYSAFTLRKIGEDEWLAVGALDS